MAEEQIREVGWGGRWGGGGRAELISRDRVVDLELRPLWARHWPSWGAGRV